MHSNSNGGETSHSFDACNEYIQQQQQPPMYEQHVAGHQSQSFAASTSWMQPHAPSDVVNVANLMMSALQNMHSESIRQQALIEIQQLILRYSADDLNARMKNREN